MGSNYSALPITYGIVDGQFSSWPTSIWAPKGILWNDGNDPATDAHLMAFWRDHGDGVYTWMKGDRDNFAEATPTELSGWVKSPVHKIGIIEDVLNLGLNYIVEVEDLTTFLTWGDTNTFTIHITLHFSATAEQVAPE